MTNVDTLASGLDWIHDTTAVYRTLLQAMARPGRIGSIRSYADKLAAASPEHRPALVLALTLLDRTTGFSVHMRQGVGLADAIRQQTFAREVSPDRAEYLFIDGDLPPQELQQLLRQASVGTLLQPELSSTVIVRIKRICGEGKVGTEQWNDGELTENSIFRLTGPGIRDTTDCRLVGLSPVLQVEREQKNAEYPTGLDLILYDGDGQVLVIPRTTRWERREHTWDTLS